MQSKPEEVRQIKDLLTHPNSIRYRKISMSGYAVQAYTPNPSDFYKPKELMLSFPGIKEQNQPILNVKVVEEDYNKRYKAETGIKSLLKAYDDTRKKNSSECMEKIGLDVMKIQSYSSNKTQHKSASLQTPAIHSKKSSKNFDLRQLSNRQMLSPLKNKSTRQSQKRQGETTEVQFRHLIQLTTSLTSFSPGKDRRDARLAVNRRDPNRVFKRQTKAQDYLYKRLQGTQKNGKEEQNQIYDKRIKSYIQFLWKVMYAHNIYINLDLKSDDINGRPKKLKAYVTLGNNGAMVRGLIKRRFWWTLVDERTPDCQFVWTQLKVNEIFSHQKSAKAGRPLLKDQDWDDEDDSPKKSKTTSKFRSSKLPYPLTQLYNTKIMYKDDAQLYKKYWLKHEKNRERDFPFKLQKNPKYLQVCLPEDSGIVHNHLQCNFYLGNKKALFYNLREYYSLIGDNVFNYVPLTFHIRKGMKDPEYNRFVEYYKRRAKTIIKESKEEDEEGVKKKTKTRNIWIVKPGENSNRGQGITVIDEIYQLNSIIKQGRITADSEGHTEQTQKTYIVQMYIDRPLLYNNRKFDIRHYMMITNFFGIIRAYWYQDGYIRTSSYEFDIDNFQPEIHLTNDAVQKCYPHYGRYEMNNKLSYEQFQRYLDTTYSHKKYNFKEEILPQMKEMGTDAARSVYTKISPKNQMNNFQILGLDFMIDKNFEPWLIEINTNPCLQCDCPLLNRIIPYMVEQSFKLSLDLAYPPPSHYPNTCKHYAPLVSLQTFKYDLIFDSQYQGQKLSKMYKRVRSNFIEQIGEIQDDDEFVDEGKECKLDDFT